MTAVQRKASFHEDVFAHEQENTFRAQARRNKLVGLWAAATMGHDNAEDYAADMAIISSDGVFARLRKDFDAAGVKMRDDDIRDRMVELLKEAAEDMRAR